MGRLIAAVLALVLLGALAGTAAAAVHVKHNDTSAEATARYWTKQRMERAKPVERAKGGGGGGKPSAGWTRFAVTPVPYAGLDRTNGKVFFTVGGTDYVCSGTAVDSATAGVNLVWTAGHCVTDGPGQNATAFTFVPAYDRGTAPFGQWAYTDIWSTEGWTNDGDFTYDLGAVRVRRAGAPGDTFAAAGVGTRPMAFDYAAAQQYRSHGYPAAGKFNGQSMYACDSPLMRRDGTSATAPMGIGCDMTGGSSGGGWVAGGAVASVNSYTYSGQKNTMFGPYQGAVARNLHATAD